MKHDPKYYIKNKRSNFLYRKFYDMRHRCYKPNSVSYKNYGGRGIKVEDWLLDFNNYVDHLFDILPNGKTIEDMQKLKYSIDRIDNNGNYERGNLRWGTRTEQGINRRIQKTNISGFQGVSWHKNNKKWTVHARTYKKRKTIGYFDTREEAFAVYLEAVKKHYGQEAYEHVLSLHPHWEAK